MSSFNPESKELLTKVSYITGISVTSLSIILEGFNRSPRYYHSSKHIEDLFRKILRYIISSDDMKQLLFIALYHDYIYNHRSITNEEESADLFIRDYEERKLFTSLTAEEAYTIYQAILDTKTHNNFTTPLSKTFCYLDLSVFADGTDKILQYERNVRKEYEWVDWAVYQKSKLAMLEKYKNLPIVQENLELFRGLEQAESFTRQLVPNIGVYAGSFNPFHKGHLNILQKAEKIFDKVIIAYGRNTEKAWGKPVLVPSCFNYKQVDYYEGSLSEYLSTKSYPVTLIRGIRNSTDLQYELNQLRWLQEFTLDVKVVNIICDKEFEHISSSAIRDINSNEARFPDLQRLADSYRVK